MSRRWTCKSRCVQGGEGSKLYFQEAPREESVIYVLGSTCSELMEEYCFLFCVPDELLDIARCWMTATTARKEDGVPQKSQQCLLPPCRWRV